MQATRRSRENLIDSRLFSGYATAIRQFVHVPSTRRSFWFGEFSHAIHSDVRRRSHGTARDHTIHRRDWGCRWEFRRCRRTMRCCGPRRRNAWCSFRRPASASPSRRARTIPTSCWPMTRCRRFCRSSPPSSAAPPGSLARKMKRSRRFSRMANRWPRSCSAGPWWPTSSGSSRRPMGLPRRSGAWWSTAAIAKGTSRRPSTAWKERPCTRARGRTTTSKT